MSLLDIAIMAVLALMGLRGLLRGLIKEVAALTALVLGGWLAYRYHAVAAAPLKPLLPAAAAGVVAFVLLLILVGLVATCPNNLLTSLVKLALLGWVNRLGGVAVGLLEGSLLLGMVLYAIIAILSVSVRRPSRPIRLPRSWQPLAAPCWTEPRGSVRHHHDCQ
ncbi:MAG: CvpA family protein [Comamonadaceae bacterium]|nr:CvpA family protein [Comamonadaceae bacterium]